MKETPEREKPQDDDLLPSFLGTWNKIYAIVIGTLLVLIIIFYLMTINLS